MELFKRRKFSLHTVFKVVIYGMVLGICIPSFLAVSMAVFRTDDFANYNTLVNADGENYFIKCIHETIRFYKSWQGTYISSFLIALFNPLRTYNYNLLHVILGVILFLAIGGLVFLVKAIIECYGGKKEYILYILGLILLPFFSYREYQEVYLWYTGSMAYLLPMAFLLFGVAFLLYGCKTGKRIYYVLSGFFMFFMGGGVLEVVGVGTFILLWLTIVEYIRKDKVNRNFLIIFCTTLAGALINACAPGNFVRRDIIDDSKIAVLKSFIVSVKAALEEIEILFRTTTLLIFVILALILGITLKRQIENKMFVILLSGLIILPVVTAFPVVLGYSATGIVYFGNRCLFVIDAVIYGSIIASAILIGNQLSIKNVLPDMKTVYFVCGFVIIVSAITQGDRIANCVPVEIVRNYNEGVIQDYSDRWISIFDDIRYSEDDDVVIAREKPQKVTGCSDTELSSDIDNWTNICIATYFNKKSVCLKEKAE